MEGVERMTLLFTASTVFRIGGLFETQPPITELYSANISALGRFQNHNRTKLELNMLLTHLVCAFFKVEPW
jgi:hypothetical protein